MIIPIEIKFGKDYTKHAALSNILSNQNYTIPEAYVFHNGNVSTSEKIKYYPVCMLTFVQREKATDSLVYKLDLRILQQ